MINVDDFLSKCKQPVKERIYRPITPEELETKKEILQYILSNRNEVNYSERVFSKLENILNELLGGNK